MERGPNYNNGINGGMEKEVKVEKRGRCGELVLRIITLVLTLVGAIVMGIDKQTKVVPLTLVSTLPPVYVPVSAKSHYMPAFVFFVVINAIACSYAAISLILTVLVNKGRNKGLKSLIIILDLVLVALLFSAVGAATFVGLLGAQGNSHVRWDKVCNVFDKFCHQVAAAIILSFIGALAFLILVVRTAFNLHNKHN